MRPQGTSVRHKSFGVPDAELNELGTWVARSNLKQQNSEARG